MDEEITIDQFEMDLRKKVEEFFKAYREGQQTQPDVFPPTMTEGDWGMQFVEHLSMGE